MVTSVVASWRAVGVTPRDHCARCLPVIRCCCLVLCLRVMHFISCHHVHCICIRVRLMHPSIFPVVRFAIRHSYALRRSPFVSCCEWVLNFLRMARGFPSGLGIAPVDRLSSFVPFGGCLILQRLTTQPKTSSFVQPKTPPKWPKTHPNPLHDLGRSITIVWAKTALHLESPNSLYL